MEFIFFTGYSCCGKTTISKLLEEREGYHFINIHAILSKIAREKGYERSRFMYKDIGIEKEMLLVTEYLFEYLNNSNYFKIVIDDVFSKSFLFSLNEHFTKENKILIAIISNNEKRLKRMASRIGVDEEFAAKELQLYDTVKNEAKLEEVINESKYVIRNDDLSIEELYKKIVEIIKNEKF
jgi:dephospho-CoA kinase